MTVGCTLAMVGFCMYSHTKIVGYRLAQVGGTRAELAPAALRVQPVSWRAYILAHLRKEAGMHACFAAVGPCMRLPFHARVARWSEPPGAQSCHVHSCPGLKKASPLSAQAKAAAAAMEADEEEGEPLKAHSSPGKA